MGAADLSCKCIAKLSGNGIPIPSSSPNMDFFRGGGDRIPSEYVSRIRRAGMADS